MDYNTYVFTDKEHLKIAQRFKVSDWSSTPSRVIRDKAHEFAIEAHEGQVRKYTGVPYFRHPQSVASILFDFGYRENHPDEDNSIVNYMRAAALLHDVVEDCDVQHKEIYERFGEEVGDLVFWLTDISRPEMGNRKLRKRIDRMHIIGGPKESQIIKCADCIDNASDILVNDPDFAVVYCKEIKILLEGMRYEVKETRIWKEAISYV